MKRFFLIFAAFVCAMNLRATDVCVPAESEDVMLQCFYWDSYRSTGKYGCTTWQELTKDSAAITANFDLVWFPPSGWAGDGTSGGVGYYNRQVSQQNSSWGYRIDLYRFMQALHRGNTKCIADIVINHRGNKSSWCDFYADNFGTFGTYQLTSAHICKNDEVNSSSSAGSCKGAATGANDTGTNFDGARDLDHSNEYVQGWAKAYLKWMLNTMQFDGFRYDMTLGYKGEYLSMYNEASQPYFSVSEYWESIDKQVNHLKATNYNTLIFDFPLKYKLGDALGVDGASGETRYNLLKNPTTSLRYRGYKRYAVTFIDNHDTFERSDNQGGEFIKYKADLGNADVKRRIMEANAYILMLPGVPCVFYPHWARYKNEISALIAIRKAAGIHSESEIEESSTISPSRTYEATITGHRGVVVLRMGVNRDKEVPAGFELALDGGAAGNYTIFLKKWAQGIDEVESGESRVKSEKFLENGQLFIRYGERVFDAQGRLVK